MEICPIWNSLETSGKKRASKQHVERKTIGIEVRRMYRIKAGKALTAVHSQKDTKKYGKLITR
jgi:hypothetical protein